MWKRIDCNVGESTRKQNDQFLVVQSQQEKKEKKKTGLNGTPPHNNDLHHWAIVSSKRKLVKYEFSLKTLLNAKRNAHLSFCNATPETHEGMWNAWRHPTVRSLPHVLMFKLLFFWKRRTLQWFYFFFTGIDDGKSTTASQRKNKGKITWGKRCNGSLELSNHHAQVSQIIVNANQC